jgi:hypothetical protein
MKIDGKTICQHAEDIHAYNYFRKEIDRHKLIVKDDKIFCSFCEDEGFFEDRNESNFLEVSDTKFGYLRKYKMWKKDEART